MTEERDTRPWTPRDHRAEAETLADQHRLQPNAIPEHHISLALYAVAHALLAQPTEVHNHPSSSAPVTWPGFAALAVLCATVLGVVWMLVAR